MKILRIADAENVSLGLQDEIRRSEESRYDHRLHGVLLVAQGLNCCQVADLLGDAPRTVAYWVERFEEDGFAGLQEGARSGRPSKLKPDQIADLQRVVRGKPSEVGLSGNLWDGKTMSARALETSCPGIFAAGDCRSGTTKRVASAVGDGALAVTCVHDLLGTYA